jgi:hypothetical protein
MSSNRKSSQCVFDQTNPTARLFLYCRALLLEVIRRAPAPSQTDSESIYNYCLTPSFESMCNSAVLVIVELFAMQPHTLLVPNSIDTPNQEIRLIQKPQEFMDGTTT